MPLDPTQAMRAVSAVVNGVRISVRAQPRSSRDAIVDVVDDGRGGSAWKIAVRAAPVEGEANAALVAFLAKRFAVPKRDVSISSGETGRNKLIEVRGVDLAAVRALLERELLR